MNLKECPHCHRSINEHMQICLLCGEPTGFPPLGGTNTLDDPEEPTDIAQESVTGPTEPVATVTKPIAATTERVATATQQESAATQQEAVRDDDDEEDEEEQETVLATKKKESPKAALLFMQQSYELHDGLNIIGRKAKKSEATVQIDTKDKTFSRQHATIMVSRMPDGDLRCVLGNYLNKNETSVNGHVLNDNEEVRLTDGCIIEMGDTSLIFKKS